MAVEAKMSNNISRHDLKGLLLFGKAYPFSLNVVSLEIRKRVMTIDEAQITIWPIKEFLEELWAGKLW
tara:strand:+ start:328 stop:531 length:204 start_codon:yes stop_codon:yes gene_type:complete